MLSRLNHKMIAFQNAFVRFADREIAPRRELNVVNEFPLDIWRKMAAAKLLGLALPRTYGGRGGDYLSVVAAGESLVIGGRNLGLALSWIIHQIVSRFFILGFGSEQQKSQYLPELAQGKITACLAISEPGVGAHPKHLTTSASFQDGQYLLTGEKSYLTNGPFADLFVVLAVTGTAGGNKEFTAFLLPRETPGCSLTEPMKLDILRPSPHCGIRLDRCSLSETQILGEIGSAYRKMAIPFRDIEDCLLTGPLIGGMRVQMEMTITALRQASVVPSDDLKSELGSLESLIHILRFAGYESASMLDSKESAPECLPLLLSLRFLAQDFQSRLSRLMDGAGIPRGPSLDVLTRDILSIINLAKNVALIKQRKIGEALLSGKD